jgi:hypothetical protein
MMNDLLANLYDQALVIQEGENFVSGNLDPVKFAELIVQECLLAISKTPVEDNEIPTMVKCHDQVEKHFGVE